jgi:hypothetical protein
MKGWRDRGKDKGGRKKRGAKYREGEEKTRGHAGELKERKERRKGEGGEN